MSKYALGIFTRAAGRAFNPAEHSFISVVRWCRWGCPLCWVRALRFTVSCPTYMDALSKLEVPHFETVCDPCRTDRARALDYRVNLFETGTFDFERNVLRGDLFAVVVFGSHRAESNPLGVGNVVFSGIYGHGGAASAEHSKLSELNEMTPDFVRDAGDDLPAVLGIARLAAI